MEGFHILLLLFEKVQVWVTWALQRVLPPHIPNPPRRCGNIEERAPERGAQEDRCAEEAPNGGQAWKISLEA